MGSTRIASNHEACGRLVRFGGSRGRVGSLTAVAASLTALSVIAARPAAAQPSFEDQSNAVGLSVIHDPSPESMGTQWYMSGGIAVADFDRDGDQDIFVLHGNGLDYLFINDGTGQFENQASEWGLTVPNAGIGASAGDYNNDGWIDIYVTTWGHPDDTPSPGQHRLYRNDEGQGFTEVASEAGVAHTSYDDPGGYGSAWGDYDLDGDLDLAVAHWFLTSEGNRLYRNNGDGTFTDVTDDALGSINGNVWGFQPVFADMNGDRYPELLYSADFETSRYYINNADGTFTEFTAKAGLGLDDNGMGNTIADFNNDLLLDWYVTSIFNDTPPPGNNPGNMLYINQGDDLFVEQAGNAGCLDGGWGWGTIAVDLDLDGLVDIIEVNGRPDSGQWEDEQAYLYHNVTTDAGNTQFEEIAVESGFEHFANQTSVAVFDADMDGDRDVLSFANSDPLKYFENTTSNGNAWLRIEFDTSMNPLLAPDGFGTRVIATVGSKSYVRHVDGQPTYLATSAIPLHFGLGDATQIDELTIEWARGYDTVLTDIAVNQTLTIEAPVVGDVNGDGSVNVSDLLELLASWGPCPEPPALCPTDTNGNGAVDVTDLLNLLGNWG